MAWLIPTPTATGELSLTEHEWLIKESRGCNDCCKISKEVYIKDLNTVTIFTCNSPSHVSVDGSCLTHFIHA